MQITKSDMPLAHWLLTVRAKGAIITARMTDDEMIGLVDGLEEVLHSPTYGHVVINFGAEDAKSA